MKLTMLLLAAAASFGGGDEKGQKPGIAVRIKPAVAVRGLDVTVGELCDLVPADGASLALARIKFGPAPSNGYARTIARAEIVQAIAAAGQDVTLLKFEGADETVVQAVTVEVSGTELLEAATTSLQAQLAVEGGDVEVEAPARVREMHAPPGRRSQELRARVRGTTGPNSAIVDVEILVDGDLHKKVPVQFKLQRFHPVLKTVGALRAGVPLGPDNLAVVREPMAQATGLFLHSMSQIEGLVAARNLQPGQRLTLGDAAQPALVHKGDLVTVVLTRGRVKVTAKALANHDAALGARITLTNLSSRQTLSGVVSGPGLVVVPQ